MVAETEVVMEVKGSLPSGGFHPNGEAQEGEDFIVAGTHAFDGEVLHVRCAGDVGEKARDAVLAGSMSIPGPDGLGIDGAIDVFCNGLQNRLDVASAERFINRLDRGEVVLCSHLHLLRTPANNETSSRR